MVKVVTPQVLVGGAALLWCTSGLLEVLLHYYSAPPATTRYCITRYSTTTTWQNHPCHKYDKCAGTVNGK